MNSSPKTSETQKLWYCVSQSVVEEKKNKKKTLSCLVVSSLSEH